MSPVKMTSLKGQLYKLVPWQHGSIQLIGSTSCTTSKDLKKGSSKKRYHHHPSSIIMVHGDRQKFKCRYNNPNYIIAIFYQRKDETA